MALSRRQSTIVQSMTGYTVYVCVCIAFAQGCHDEKIRGEGKVREKREEGESLGITTTLYYYYYEHNGRRSPGPTDSMID